MICQSCGRESSTKYVDFYQNIGMLVVRSSKSVKGNLCKDCINKYFWSYTGTTLILGWWGAISFIVTPFILLNNIIRYIGAIGLEPPNPNAVRPQLTEDAVSKIQPYTEEIVRRLSNGEKIEQVAYNIGQRAGVTPGQVVLYVAVLVEYAKQKQHA